MASSAAIPSATYAIFFDNDAAQCASVEAVAVPGRMTIVHVGGSVAPPPLQCIPFTPGETNAYRAMMYRLHGEAGLCDKHDPLAGIKQAHVDLADRWTSMVKAQRAKNLSVRGAACFDWDRTITTMEGTNIRDTERLLRKIQAQGMPNGLEMGSRLLRDTFAWHLGGERRMVALQRLMERLSANGIDVYIVSNNRLAEDPLFQRMVQTQLFPGCALNFICTSGAPYGKGPVLQSHPAFRDVTTASHASAAAGLLALSRDPRVAAAVVPSPEENAALPPRATPTDAMDASAVDALTALMKGASARRTRRTTRKRRGTSRKNKRFQS